MEEASSSAVDGSQLEGPMLEITDMRVPQVVEDGTQTSIILDCIYSLRSADKRSELVVQWYHQNGTSPVYQVGIFVRSLIRSFVQDMCYSVSIYGFFSSCWFACVFLSFSLSFFLFPRGQTRGKKKKREKKNLNQFNGHDVPT